MPSKEEIHLRSLEKKLDKLAKTPVYSTPKYGKLLDEYWNLKSIVDQKNIMLGELTDDQKAKIKVEHYTLHLPAYLTKEQLTFIQSIAKSVVNNQPIVICHHEAIRRLLRWAYLYRNTLIEFDEQNRWTDVENRDLEKISVEFKPILDWIVENWKVDISKFRRD